mgnify:CR=1 FL=1
MIESLTFAEYMQMIKLVVDFTNKNKREPNYVIGKYISKRLTGQNITLAQYKDMKKRVDEFILDVGRNPKVVGINKAADEPSEISPELKPYLQPSQNCQSNNPGIIALAKQIVGNETSKYNKAYKIYEYVRWQKDYIHYYRTRHGALGMLKSRTGNCYDLSHLFIALCRAAGLPARYHSVIAKFSNVTEGHMFGEVYVDGKWYRADASHNKNNLGNIKSWKLSVDRGTYREITT